GGPNVWTSFVQDGLADELMVYMAPKFLGAGVASLGDLGFPSGKGFRVREWQRLGDDVYWNGTVTVAD
ncbi:MAG: dihydrofolate reductase family protein, partial [bacterium]|nr:dihydrofolate reductase family protein [bacterium]